VAVPSNQSSEKAVGQGDAHETSNGSSDLGDSGKDAKEEVDNISADASSTASKPSEQQPPIRNPEKVMVCLKRALKIAHAAQQQLAAARKTSDTQPVALFVEILNHYVYYYKQGLPSITSSVMQVITPQQLVSCLFAN
jgi:Vacuolar protein sorting-associated protein 35